MSSIAAVGQRDLSVARMSAIKIVLIWMGVTLLAFPLGGYLGWGIGGHVDAIGSSLIVGAITGTGIGFAQWLFLKRDLGIGPIWILATSLALAAGLGIGAAVVDYETSVSALMIMGAISGAAIGVAQGLLLRDRFSLWFAWMVAMPPLFALGWFVTNSAGIDVDNQFPVFGASGCIVFGLLSGTLLALGKRAENRPAV